MWDLGLKSAGTQSGFWALRRRSTPQSVCRSTPQSVCRSIVVFAHQSIVMVRCQLRVFVILSPKYTKSTTFLQITPRPENILERLQNNYNVFKKTYIPWLKVGKIYGISTPPDILFCLSSCKTRSSLSGSSLKTAETHMI